MSLVCVACLQAGEPRIPWVGHLLVRAWEDVGSRSWLVSFASFCPVMCMPFWFVSSPDNIMHVWALQITAITPPCILLRGPLGLP